MPQEIAPGPATVKRDSVPVAVERGGILPNRDAMSKRKLCEHFAQPPQIIHRFSTVDISVARAKNFIFGFARVITTRQECNFQIIFPGGRLTDSENRRDFYQGAQIRKFRWGRRQAECVQARRELLSARSARLLSSRFDTSAAGFHLC